MAGNTLEHEGHIVIPLPDSVLSSAREEDTPSRDKTSFFVNKAVLLQQVPFISSAIIPGLQVTTDIQGVLKVIALHAQESIRYPKGEEVGLENDPTKLQPIIYTAVLAEAKGQEPYVLAYQRANKNTYAEKRLHGNWSIGFGGHTTGEDKRRLSAVEYLVNGFHGDIQRADALEAAMVNEFREELGISPKDVVRQLYLGAFFEEFSADKLVDTQSIPVGAVHLCIPTVAVLDASRFVAGKALQLPRSEIADAEWVPLSKLGQALQGYENKGGVESWTRIMSEEFLPKYSEI